MDQITEMKRSVDMPMQLRAGTFGAVNAEKRTVELTWTTGARVRQFDWMTGERFWEELSLDPKHVRMGFLQSGNAPLLNAHSRGAIADQIGVVESATLTDKEGRAQVRFSSREDVKPIFQDVQDKIVRNVSIGYAIYRMEEAGRAPDGLKVYRAVDWEPKEISFLPIGADAGAGVRSPEKDRSNPCEIIETTPAATANNQRNTMHTEQELAAQKVAADKLRAEQEIATRVAAEAKVAAEKAIAAERSRTSAIRALCAQHKMDRAFEDGLIGNEEKPGVTLDKAREAVLAKLAEVTEGAQIRSGHTGIETVQDETVVRRSMMANALLHRANPSLKLEDGARPYVGYTLRELMRNCLEQRGIRTAGMSVDRMWERTLVTDGDLPAVVLDAANKSLRPAYESTPRTFVPFTKRGSAPDFKNMNRVQLSGAPSLDLVQANAEYKRGAVTDGKEAYALSTYGKIIGISRKTIYNDDLGAFTRIPALFGRAAADMESDTVWGIITANGTLQTTTFALFGTSHANLTTGAATGTINVAQIGVGRAAMRTKTGLEGRIINIQPKFLIVPAAKEGDAEQFTSANYVASSQASINPYAPLGRNPLTPIVEPRLDANSTAKWYLAADPAQVDTIEYSYLEGQEGVYIESRMGFDVDGLEMKVREDFAAKALDYRGLHQMAGA